MNDKELTETQIKALIACVPLLALVFIVGGIKNEINRQKKLMEIDFIMADEKLSEEEKKMRILSLINFQ